MGSGMFIELSVPLKSLKLRRSDMNLTPFVCFCSVQRSIHMPLLRSWDGRRACLTINMALLTELVPAPGTDHSIENSEEPFFALLGNSLPARSSTLSEL